MSAAADVAASHRALDTPFLPIEGARTHAPAIITGVAAVFPAFQARSSASWNSTPQLALSCQAAPDHLPIHRYRQVNNGWILARMADFLPALGSVESRNFLVIV